MTELSCDNFIWETHGIHAGTANDHVKHGVDELDEITEKAINRHYPNLTFIIHTPRLTRFRYKAEENTDIKFIRGDRAYMNYAGQIADLRERYGDKINIRYGIELEWLGSGLGVQWNRSKVFQAEDADFIVGSVHFSPEGIPYDGSREETEQLLELRGGAEAYWAGYIEEMIEMVDSSWDIIQVVGHIDLPKLYVDTPKPLLELETSSHPLAKRMRVLLEMIKEYNLTLDVNLAGIKKGCGIYPSLPILKHARKLGISISLGTDTHHVDHLGDNYQEGIKYAIEAGYHQYVSFTQCIPEKRPLIYDKIEKAKFKTLNLGIELLNRRFQNAKQKRIPKFSFGGKFRTLLENYSDATSMGEFDAIRIRRENRAVTITNHAPDPNPRVVRGLYSVHKDEAGVLSILFNTLASEEINVETAFLNSHEDGTASAFLTVTGDESRIMEAIEFIKGTANDLFEDIQFGDELELPTPKQNRNYILEVDGIELPIPISQEMIMTVHNNSAGVLLILLSALGAKGVNIKDMQLGERGGKGYAILGIESNGVDISGLLSRLGPQYHEASMISLNNFFK